MRADSFVLGFLCGGAFIVCIVGAYQMALTKGFQTAMELQELGPAALKKHKAAVLTLPWLQRAGGA
jgi:hypothetical protein